MVIPHDNILELLNEGCLIIDQTGTIVSSNSAVSDLTGYTAEELKNKPFYTLGEGRVDAIQYQYELDQAVHQRSLITEGWKKKKNGERYWSETSYSVISNNEIHQGYCILLRDISQRKQIELELLKREEQYRTMVEAVKDYSIFMLDPEGNILTWNDGATLIHGYMESEVLGRNFSIFYTADDLLARKPETELEITKLNGTYREEGWRAKKGGALFWASVVMTAMYNDHNEFIGYCKVTRDLTERLESEENLRSSEARYRSLVEQVADYGIFMLDTKGRIVSWNEGAKRIKGYTAEQVIGKYFSIFYTQEDIVGGKPARELRIARATGKYEEEGWRLRKDGGRFWANIVITAVYDKDKQLTGFSKVTRDLTERKMDQQRLLESSNRYKSLVDDLQITNQRLIEVNKELKEFTAIVSHDLKEPVRTVKSFLYLSNQQLASQDLKEASNSINKGILGAQRMQDLIDNLLEYTQVSSSEIKWERVSLSEVMIHVEQSLHAAIKRGNAIIKLDLQTDHVYGDHLRLIQLFQNLVSNALKFSGQHPPVVTVRSWIENDQVRIAVDDNGIGIAPQHLERIFGVFKRLHFSSQYPGTGIGLAICKKVVDRHEGKIWVESVVGQGASFNISMPANNQTLAND